METITKDRQSAETLRAIVARAYSPGQASAGDEDWVSELGHGWFKGATPRSFSHVNTSSNICEGTDPRPSANQKVCHRPGSLRLMQLRSPLYQQKGLTSLPTLAAAPGAM